jgi:hypothetical protein
MRISGDFGEGRDLEKVLKEEIFNFIKDGFRSDSLVAIRTPAKLYFGYVAALDFNDGIKIGAIPYNERCMHGKYDGLFTDSSLFVNDIDALYGGGGHCIYEDKSAPNSWIQIKLENVTGYAVLHKNAKKLRNDFGKWIKHGDEFVDLADIGDVVVLKNRHGAFKKQYPVGIITDLGTEKIKIETVNGGYTYEWNGVKVNDIGAARIIVPATEIVALFKLPEQNGK